MRAAQNRVAGWRPTKVEFAHVPREKNQWSDWLANVALKSGRSVPLQELVDGHVLPDARPPVLPSHALPGVRSAGGGHSAGDSAETGGSCNGGDAAQPAASVDAEVVTCVTFGEGDALPTRCDTCGWDDMAAKLQCDACPREFHRGCVDAEDVPQRRGPWHCRSCQRSFRDQGLRDITLDELLLWHLATGELPEDEDAARRVLRASQWVRLDDRGVVWVSGP